MFARPCLPVPQQLDALAPARLFLPWKSLRLRSRCRCRASLPLQPSRFDLSCMKDRTAMVAAVVMLGIGIAIGGAATSTEEKAAPVQVRPAAAAPADTVAQTSSQPQPIIQTPSQQGPLTPTPSQAGDAVETQ